MHEGYNEHPINPLPAVVWLLAAPILIGEIAFGLGQAGVLGPQNIGLRLDMLQRFAFDPGIARAMVEQNTWPWTHVIRTISYGFVHASLTHALMVLVFVLALGKMVGELFSGWAVAAVFFGATIAGAVVYAALPFTTVAIYGGYPGAYGLIGAFTWILWTRLGAAQASRARAFSLIGMLMAIQLLFSVFFGGRPDWIADLSGFVAGFGLSFLVGPGGWRRALARIRQR
ncbi:rhomboid family intramembrane serine protease [Paenirhodobacter sp. CAU 1674]|jgi:membrane associated rhomboid family serine protease|uniref:rhomboid family intramembrane serine protease n=1 Tax=Paenirhodobacter sp. CAU 1674 TaxID=3032596 RepID=UPI0023DC3F3E|nr:rhomboid family intramembrane serine protease [Paenirhodobacter sp. CAU 1674]MDF2141539.1 rhomboid family intramembrane serine protease [Paenirhodobacter sp. CAU 1674]